MAKSEKYTRVETPHHVKYRKKESFWRKMALLSFLATFGVGLFLFCVLTFRTQFHCNEQNHENFTPQEEHVDEKNKLHFLWFSDIHLDLYYKPSASPDWSKSYCRNEDMKASYDAPFGRIGCDSPPSLLRNALYAMRDKGEKAKFIIMTGDFSAHELDREFSDNTTRRQRVLNAIKTGANEIKMAFPALPFFPSVGNNDLPGHYILPEEGDSWYQDLLDTGLEEMILCKLCGARKTTTKIALRETFLKGGYYKVNLPDTEMMLLVLNSMLWSQKCWVGSEFMIESANEQMKWLKKELRLAKKLGRKVLIQSHMPPGTDTFSPPYPQVWLKNYTEEYLDIVTNGYSDIIVSQLYAHFHTDEYRLLRSQTDPRGQRLSHILLSASISPCFNNNPNFRIVQINKKYEALEDFLQYYIELVVTTEFNMPYWQLDYKFSKRYPPSGKDDKMINGKRIMKLNEDLINVKDNTVWINYFASHTVHHMPSSAVDRFVLYCGMKHILGEDFAKCHSKYKVTGA